jgi:hypothetical protein
VVGGRLLEAGKIDTQLASQLLTPMKDGLAFIRASLPSLEASPILLIYADLTQTCARTIKLVVPCKGSVYDSAWRHHSRCVCLLSAGSLRAHGLHDDPAALGTACHCQAT